MAFRMQTSVPELMDLSDEPQNILDLYGAKGSDGTFAANCLLARRLAERGVRFVQLYHRGWDHHGDLVRYMNTCCGLCDRPAAALVQDLKQRGLLDETLVIWGGEFGRTPMFQGKGKDPGRDHHIRGFSMWLAGGGIRGGVTYGATDELGYTRRGEPGPRARFARDHAALTWHRSPASDLQVSRARLPSDRRRESAGGEGDIGLRRR